MYQLDTHTLSLDGRPILRDVKTTITAADDVQADLVAHEAETQTGADVFGAYAQTSVRYDNGPQTEAERQRRVDLVMRYTAYEGALVANAAYQAQGEPLADNSRRLHPTRGIAWSAELSEADAVLGLYRHKHWWTRPAFAPSVAGLPEHTQALFWRTGDLYHCLLPAVGSVFKTEAAGDGTRLCLTTFAGVTGYRAAQTVTFALASGPDPFVLAERAAGAALHALGTPRRLRQDRRYPALFDGLGWLTWDAFYYDVDADGIRAKAEEFTANGLPVRWFIIDAGWSEQRNDALSSRRAQPDKFPGGLAPLVRSLKGDYGLAGVGVWHTLIGFWNGLDPDGPLAHEGGESVVTAPSGLSVPAPDAGRAFVFWDAWHRDLRRQGIDFVKVDYQGQLAQVYDGLAPIGRVAEQAHAGLDASVAKNFDGAVINCMGMASENLWHRPASALSRNSDDFFPKTDNWLAEHAVQNAYNALYQGVFMHTDWDSFWTDHVDAERHAWLRAVSGGPIYIGDPVGTTKPELIWPLILHDGRILRADGPGLPTRDCLFADPFTSGVPLKIWNAIGEARVAAVFNLDQAERALTGTLRAEDIPGLSGRLIVWDAARQAIYPPMPGEALPLSLPPRGAAWYVLVPQTSVITPIGLVNKHLTPATIMARTVRDDGLEVTLVEGGRFVFACESAQPVVSINGRAALAEPVPGGYAVACAGQAGPVRLVIRLA
jgi:hypothetical protein